MCALGKVPDLGLIVPMATLLAMVQPLAAQSPEPVDSIPPLFSSYEPIPITLTADLGALRGDRNESPDRPALLTVPLLDGGATDLDIQVRTRGEFRLDPANCSFPPLRLDVPASRAAGTVFAGQDKLKVVSSCRPGRDTYDQLVLKEYLVYRMYQVLTPRSYRVRLVQLTLIDTRDEAETETRTAFLIEEDEALAARLGGSVFELEEGKNLPNTAFEPMAHLMTAVFQYMIGSTDWSAVAGHNVEIIDRGGVATAVPYDFDISGLVDAPYATSNPDYDLDSVRDRYYRGWCTNPINTRAVLDTFRSSQEEVMALWVDVEGLSADTTNRARRYLEEFFDSIETDERAQRRFLRDCRS